MMCPLAFERGEEALHWSIIIPGPGTVHTGANPVVPQQLLIAAIGVLTALIRVMNTPYIDPTSLKGHVQSAQREIAGHSI